MELWKMGPEERKWAGGGKGLRLSASELPCNLEVVMFSCFRPKAVGLIDLDRKLLRWWGVSQNLSFKSFVTQSSFYYQLSVIVSRL